MFSKIQRAARVTLSNMPPSVQVDKINIALSKYKTQAIWILWKFLNKIQLLKKIQFVVGECRKTSVRMEILLTTHQSSYCMCRNLLKQWNKSDGSKPNVIIVLVFRWKVWVCVVQSISVLNFELLELEWLWNTKENRIDYPVFREEN